MQYLCNMNSPDGGPERCVRPWEHSGSHVCVEGENLEDVPTPPVLHQAAKGLAETTIQHIPGACSWCDAVRYRTEHLIE